MSDDEIIDLAKQLGWNTEHHQTNRMLILFAQDIEDRTRSADQERINTLHRMYEQARDQRDALMDQQSAMVAAMRGRKQ